MILKAVVRGHLFQLASLFAVIAIVGFVCRIFVDRSELDVALLILAILFAMATILLMGLFVKVPDNDLLTFTKADRLLRCAHDSFEMDQIESLVSSHEDLGERLVRLPTHVKSGR